MSKKLCKRRFVVLLLFANLCFFSSKAQQTLLQIGGWNAYVHLPDDYSTTSKKYPTIIFFPGIGEIGTNASLVISNGPGAYITQGWDGNVNIDGNTVKFIVISLQPPSAFPLEFTMNQKIQLIKSMYRVDSDRLYLTGLSHGGWCSSTFVTGDPYGGPYTYASQIAAVVTVEGMVPDDNSPYPNLFDNFAHVGGKYLGFEQMFDGRDTRTVVDRMNSTVPGSGIYISTNFGGGGHCCWASFYGGQGTQPGIWSLGGITQNLYQWLARQSLSNTTNIPPVVNAGPDQTVTLPTSTTALNGSATDADGTVSFYKWSQVAGPNTATINNNANPFTNVSGLIQGIYTFVLKATDNLGGSAVDSVNVVVNPDPASITCNPNAPVTYNLNYTQPGEIYRPNGSMWKGGDTIKITGTSYTSIEFYNVAGDACRPLVIMPLTTVSTPVFRFKGNCRYIKVWGGKTQYGIKVNGGPLAITSCHHIEADNIECYGGSVGIYCKQDVDYSDPMTWNPNYRMTKLTFRNMYIHDVPGEGMYIGITQPDGLTVTSTYSGLDTVIVPIRLDSVEVSNCRVERTGWDGIQLSNSRNGNKIFNNTVTDYGTLNVSTQQAGIILGGNTNGDVYGNIVKRGTGNGMQLFGYGVINVYNNTMDSCGYDGNTNSNGTEGQQTIYASDYTSSSESNPPQTINAFGNNINHPKTSGGIFITDYFNNSYPSSIYNNNFCITNPPGNWQSIYIKGYVPGSSLSNNILSCSTSNQPPTANAGVDISITLPTSTATLNGSGTDPDGVISSYAWVKISGPATGTITSPSSATTTLTALTQGVYKYQLTVTDNAGATAKDTVQVTVNAAANQPPTANAGVDISITLPTNTATLNGSGTDPDGVISSYAWVKISGPATGTITAPSSATTTLTALTQGVYQYQLTVTDNSGATAKDVVKITVTSPTKVNLPPTANAGSDQTIYLPDNSVTLSGTGNVPNGNIVSYGWRVINTPGTYSFSNVNAAETQFSSLLQGIYKVELTVTDNFGDKAYDTISVNVGSSRLSSAPLQDVKIYPNPVSDNLNVEITSTKADFAAMLTLFDSKGVRVYQKLIKISGNSKIETINVSNLRSGFYFLQVNYDNKKQVTKKVVKI
ncbi:MAG: T9SS type A sorting domain-containing protein [Ferruginibacter sp.]